MTIVRTRTPSGEAIVILPEVEFERLVALAEDAADARAIIASQERLEGGDDLLTEADLDALRAARSPLAFWRERRGLSIAALARFAGIDEGVVEGLDGGDRRADADLHARLAKALGIEPEDLFETDPN